MEKKKRREGPKERERTQRQWPLDEEKETEGGSEIGGKETK
jgi:hypothetical protein